MAVGGASLPVPDHDHARDVAGIAYVRPHELDVEPFVPGAEGIVAELKRVHSIGPLAQLELQRGDDHSMIEAQLPADHFARLNLQQGAKVLVRPKRVRVFLQDAA